MSLSRKERRQAAKKMGYLSQDNSFKNFAERLGRSNQAGSMIHQRHLEDQRWDLKKQEEIRERERLMSEINARKESHKEEEFRLDVSSFDFLNQMENGEDQPQ
jgi:hypothetical protein